MVNRSLNRPLTGCCTVQFRMLTLNIHHVKV